jgi:hypothetical protein
VFNEDHFAPRLVKQIRSPLSAVEAAIALDLQAHALADGGFPEDLQSKEFTILFDDEGTPVTIVYRPYFLPDSNTISVGTVFVPEPK